MPPVLEVSGLRTKIRVPGGTIDVVRNVDFVLDRNEVLGLIGESGSGKTITGLSILRLLPEAASTEARVLRFQGSDLAAIQGAEFRALRGRHLAMVFQNPAGALNPAKTIAWHMREVLGRRGHGDWRTAADSGLRDVGIGDPARTLKLFPYQLSGGMLQRVLIAMVLALEPEVVVADEPTTNLDNIVERQILLLFRRLKERLSGGILFITHDMSVAAALCDRIMVMYAGEIVETGRTGTVLESPRHPYTQGLRASAAALAGDGRLAEIPGELPSGFDQRPGCRFAPRCTQARESCHAIAPPMVTMEDGHQVRCMLYA